MRLLSRSLRTSPRLYRQSHLYLRLSSSSSSSPLTPQSTPPTPSTSTSTTPDDPLVHPSPRKPKHKVELRPAPVKPSAPSGNGTFAATTSTSLPPLRAITPSSSSASHTRHPPQRTTCDTHNEPFDHLLRREDILADFAVHDLKPPPPGLTTIQAFWFTLKQYAKFYLRGIRMIWKHRSHAALIRARIASEQGAPLSRWESRFLQAHRADMMKLPPFLLLLVILEEIIPLVVIYAPSILPSTCILPSQMQKISEKADERHKKWLDVLRKSESRRTRWQSLVRRAVEGRSLRLRELDGEDVRILCGILRLSTTGPDFIIRTRVDRRLTMIIEDDALLTREGRGAWLDARGVREALAERGAAPPGPHLGECYEQLRRYLDDVETVDPKHESGVGRRLSWVMRDALPRAGGG